MLLKCRFLGLSPPFALDFEIERGSSGYPSVSYGIGLINFIRKGVLGCMAHIRVDATYRECKHGVKTRSAHVEES